MTQQWKNNLLLGAVLEDTHHQKHHHYQKQTLFSCRSLWGRIHFSEEEGRQQLAAVEGSNL